MASLSEAQLLFQNGKVEEALKCLESATVPNCDELFLRACIYRRMKCFGKAAEDLSKVIEHDRNYETAFAYRGCDLAELGLFTLAISDYSKALRLNSSDTSTYFNRAESYIKLENWKSAISDFSKYIREEKKDAEAYCRRGMCYRMVGDIAAAQRDLNEAIELDKNGAYGAQARGELELIDVGTYNATAKREKERTDVSLSQVEKGDDSDSASVAVPIVPKYTQSPHRQRQLTRSVLKKSGKKTKATGKNNMRVRFDKVLIRSHMRSLGTSGGVPQRGGIALGITDAFLQEESLPIESWEEKRRIVRTDKDSLEPAPARQRKLLLQAAMGKEDYFKAHRVVTRQLQTLRKHREEAVEKDKVWNPEFGTLDDMVAEITRVVKTNEESTESSSDRDKDSSNKSNVGTDKRSKSNSGKDKASINKSNVGTDEEIQIEKKPTRRSTRRIKKQNNSYH
eukprot:g3396.t1